MFINIYCVEGLESYSFVCFIDEIVFIGINNFLIIRIIICCKICFVVFEILVGCSVEG